MSKEEELKPCPFCGNEAKTGYHNHSENWSTRCDDWKCPSKTSSQDRSRSIAAWNTRTPDITTLLKNQEELETALYEISMRNSIDSMLSPNGITSRAIREFDHLFVKIAKARNITSVTGEDNGT